MSRTLETATADMLVSLAVAIGVEDTIKKL